VDQHTTNLLSRRRPGLLPFRTRLALAGPVPSAACAEPPPEPDLAYPHGRHDAITDVPGVRAGLCTHDAPNVWRGVTVILASEAGGPAGGKETLR
jgi:hypothetical protein